MRCSAGASVSATLRMRLAMTRDLSRITSPALNRANEVGKKLEDVLSRGGGASAEGLGGKGVWQ